MQKQAPSVGRILTMVLFALSCFGLLLFLWLSFGGPIPLKPQSYRFKVALPESTQLGLEADVRVAGVPVGKVRKKEIDPDGNRTIATVEMQRKYAPIRKSARVILRQKTLLGETYMEITPGDPNGATLPEGGTLPNAQVKPTTELDEIFQALDPTTRQAFRTWQQSLAPSIRGRGQNLSDAFGNLPNFAASGTDLLRVLDEENGSLRGVVRDTGSVFEALTRNEGALRGLITNSAGVFRAIASQNDALAETFRIFPTFLDESRATLTRLQRFAINTDPLVQDLRPVARDLRPTLRDVRLLAPDLRRFFVNLDPLITVSRRGLPALRDTLRGLRPLLGETGPFLSQLNPILSWISLYQRTTAGFIGNAAAGLAAHTDSSVPGAPGHYLRQIGPTGFETVGVHATRPKSNRGNTYLPEASLNSLTSKQKLIFPNWDCKNTSTGGEVPPDTSGPPNGAPACYVGRPQHLQNMPPGAFPRVVADSYAG